MARLYWVNITDSRTLACIVCIGEHITVQLLNSSTDAPLEVALTIIVEDSNGQQSPLPHLEPRVDECIFEVQSTVPK